MSIQNCGKDFQVSNLLSYGVTTLALGSRPRQKGLKGASQEECENEDSHS
jgi:hypothetical protein